jgi:penicillin amidase
MKTKNLSGWRLVPAVAVALATGCDPTTIDLPLGADTEVLIDKMGVPHIYAQNDRDAMFASGYVMAKLRLFQLEMVRRQAHGTQAEVLGESGLRGDLAARTFAFSQWGKRSRDALRQDYPDEAQLIEAFVRGINHYIDRVGKGNEPLPPEMAKDGLDFQPTMWSDDDPYIIGKMLSFGMSSSLDSELLASVLKALAPKFPSDFPLCMPTRNAFTMPGTGPQPVIGNPVAAQGPAVPTITPELRAEALAALAQADKLAPQLGSNNWAVAGKATAMGTPLLAGDPHQPLGSPIRFFVQHLNSADKGGSLDVVGFGFAGTPGIQLGHNRTVAWSATTNFADVMDMWEVPAPSGSKIVVGGKEYPIGLRNEKIRLRSPGGKVPVGDDMSDVREYQITDVPGVGVLLPDELLPVPRAIITPQQILFAWTGLAATHEAAMYLGLDRSRTLNDWEGAAKRLEVGAVNLIAADQKNIRYRVYAQIPDRGTAHAMGVQPWKLMSGTDPRTMWTGKFLSDDKLPSARDPERGYLSTANNEPFGFTADGRVDNDPYYYGYFYDPGDRAARIETELQRLVQRGKVTPADMVALQWDARSTLADDLIPALGQVVAELGTDPQLAEFRNRPELLGMFTQLSSWDRQMRKTSPEAVMFFAFAHFATVRALSDELGPLLPKLFDVEPAYAYKPLRLALRRVKEAEPLLSGERNRILFGGLADAADWLKQRFGSALPSQTKPYLWQDVHSARFDHVLGDKWNAGNFPVDGSVGTVNVSSSAMSDASGKIKPTWSADDGSLFRMVVSFDSTGLPSANVNFPRGNSGDPSSPYHANQHPNWLAGKQEKLLFARPEIESNLSEKLTIRRDGSVN